MKVIYTGPFADGTVADNNGREFGFKNGVAVELPNDLAASLISQKQHWAAATDSKKEAK